MTEHPPSGKDSEESVVEALLRAAGSRPPIPAERLAALTESAEQSWRRMVHRHRRRRWAFVGSLAAVVLAVAVVVVVQRVETGNKGTGVQAIAGTVERLRGTGLVEDRAGGPSKALAAADAIPTGAIVRTLEASRMAISLGEGLELRLDASSRVRLASSTLVELEAGALYVDDTAAPTGAEPLSIQTPYGRVRHVGTQFEVRLGARGVLVKVREGDVDVDSRGISYRLPAGQALTLSERLEPVRETVEPFGPAWSWLMEVAEPFQLENRSLPEYLDWLQRETGWSTRFVGGPPTDLEDIVLHGSIGHLRPDLTVGPVLRSCGMSHSIRDGILEIHQETDRGRPDTTHETTVTNK